MNFDASSSQAGSGGAGQHDPDATEIAAIAHGLDRWSILWAGNLDRYRVRSGAC